METKTQQTKKFETIKKKKKIAGTVRMIEAESPNGDTRIAGEPGENQ